MIEDTHDRWYVVQTQARAEAKAVFNLRRQGFDAYLPQYLKQRRHARRVDWVPAPLFPRYLFVRLDVDTAQWRPILSTIGVIDLIRHGLEPVAVPDAVVDEIRGRHNDGGFVVIKPADSFRKGERVNIVGGAFADQVGLFDCATDEERVVLLLDLLGRQVRVEVALEDLASVG